jgi:hypothetical protein
LEDASPVLAARVEAANGKTKLVRKHSQPQTRTERA